MEKFKLITYFKKIKGKLYEIEKFIDYHKKYDSDLFKSNEETTMINIIK